MISENTIAYQTHGNLVFEKRVGQGTVNCHAVDTNARYLLPLNLYAIRLCVHIFSKFFFVEYLLEKRLGHQVIHNPPWHFHFSVVMEMYGFYHQMSENAKK